MASKWRARRIIKAYWMPWPEGPCAPFATARFCFSTETGTCVANLKNVSESQPDPATHIAMQALTAAEQQPFDPLHCKDDDRADS
eukprot:COSAG01_NODE_3666_length_5799_cov_5.810957_1_plen_85_part_00